MYFLNTLPKLQQKLLLHIDENPGIRYRELLRLVNSSNGVLSYHIEKLERMDLINVERRTRITRYFPRNISDEIMGIIGNLRNQTSYEIIKLLFDRGPISQQEIIKYTTSFLRVVVPLCRSVSISLYMIIRLTPSFINGTLKFKI